MRTQEERDKIVLENFHLVEKGLGVGLRMQIDFDDAYSIAMHSLLKAASKWRGESKFSTYYYRVVFNDMLIEKREERRRLPLDIGIGVFDVEIENRADEVLDAKKSLKRIMQKAYRLRQDARRGKDRRIAAKAPQFVHELYKGLTVKEAAERAGFAKCTGVRMVWQLRKAA